MTKRQGADAITADDVVGWYRNAGGARGRIPSAADVASLVRLVNAQRQWLCRPRDRETSGYVDIAKVHKVQSLVRDLACVLPDVVEIYRRAGLDHLATNDGKTLTVRKDPAEECLRQLLEVVGRASRHLGDPHGRGPRKPVWQTIVDSLSDPVRRGWEAAGRRRPPIAPVMCRALCAIDGRKRSADTVATYLKRRRGEFPAT